MAAPQQAPIGLSPQVENQMMAPQQGIQNELSLMRTMINDAERVPGVTRSELLQKLNGDVPGERQGPMFPVRPVNPLQKIEPVFDIADTRPNSPESQMIMAQQQQQQQASMSNMNNMVRESIMNLLFSQPMTITIGNTELTGFKNRKR